MSTYLLSYPEPGFRPDKADANHGTALRAYQQWLDLCDHIMRAGGRILVLDPGPPSPSRKDGLADSVYAAYIGAPFLAPASGSGPLFLRARGTGEPRAVADDAVCSALSRAGLAVQVAEQRWQGQAEIIVLPRNRFLLTYGPHSDPASCEQVKRLLPLGAHVLCIQMATGSGLSGLAHLTAKGGASMLLVARNALASHTPEDIGKFIGSDTTEIHILSSEDIAAHATESLCVRGTVLMPPGTSTQLRGHLSRRGFQIVVVDVSALFGPAGGGPKTLCNEWPGFVLSDDSPSYASRRDELVARIDTYRAPRASA